jgi:hypothetical protein
VATCLPAQRRPYDAMTWFKIDDSFYDHPKVFDAPDCAVALWTRAGTWSARNLTDGFVPAGLPARLCDDPDTAIKELVRRGLWKRTNGGFRFHDWNEYQPAAEAVKELRAKRAAAGRKGGQVKAANAKQPPSNGLASASDVAKQTATPSRPDPKGRVVDVDLLGGQAVSRTREEPPPNRCPEHLHSAEPPPCGKCADARRAREQHDRGQAAEASAAQARRAREDADSRASAIGACRLCDADGYRGGRVCPHDPDIPHRVRRGAAAARAALARPGAA